MIPTMGFVLLASYRFTPQWCGSLFGKTGSNTGQVKLAACRACGGEMKALAAITDPLEVKRYLKHEGIDYDPPARSPPRSIQQSFVFDQLPAAEEEVIYID